MVSKTDAPPTYCPQDHEVRRSTGCDSARHRGNGTGTYEVGKAATTSAVLSSGAAIMCSSQEFYLKQQRNSLEGRRGRV